MGKEPVDKEPSDQFKERILIAEHSPIRAITINWIWYNVMHWITVHWVRHKWEKYVRTERTDRTGIPRNKLPQDEPQSFWGEANVQHLIDTMRKRLCFTASPETRQYAEDLKITVHKEVDPFIAHVMVPNCVYRAGCPELKPCGFYEELMEHYPELPTMPIAERYACYNEYFEKEHRYVGTP